MENHYLIWKENKKKKRPTQMNTCDREKDNEKKREKKAIAGGSVSWNETGRKREGETDQEIQKTRYEKCRMCKRTKEQKQSYHFQISCEELRVD